MHIVFLAFMLLVFSHTSFATYDYVYYGDVNSSYHTGYYADVDHACTDAIEAFNIAANVDPPYIYDYWLESQNTCYGHREGGENNVGVLSVYKIAYNPENHDPVKEYTPTTDEQCLALNDDYGDDMMMILDFDPGELEWEGTGSGAGCMFKSDAGVAVEVGGKWHVPFYATGAAEDISGSTDPIDATGPEPAEGGELASSDDYTPTTDPQTDCQFSNVTLGGETYCYTGEYAPQDSSYPDGSIRVDNPDGSYDIVEPDGTTTEYTADGSIKTPSSAPDTAGGEDYGEGESGIIKAISGLKNSVENGFDKLVDKFTGKADEVVDELTEEAPEGDSLIGDSNLDELSDQVDQKAEEHTDNVTEKLDEIGEDDSSPIADQVTGNFPDLPSSSCTPLTFGQAPFEFTISCDVFNKIRTWFGWIIYFWTVVSIMDTFFAPVSRRA